MEQLLLKVDSLPIGVIAHTTLDVDTSKLFLDKDKASMRTQRVRQARSITSVCDTNFWQGAAVAQTIAGLKLKLDFALNAWHELTAHCDSPSMHPRPSVEFNTSNLSSLPEFYTFP